MSFTVMLKTSRKIWDKRKFPFLSWVTTVDCESYIYHRKKQLDSAVVSAKRYRKGRWICLAITLVILAVVGIAVGIQVSKNVNNGNSNNNNNSNNSST